MSNSPLMSLNHTPAPGSETQLHSPFGLIAGNGRFPFAVAEQARALGLRVVAVAHRGETDPQLEQCVDECVWVRVGQLGKLVGALKRAKVREAMLAGGISRLRLFGGARPDFLAVKLITRLGTLRDDVLLRGVAAELELAGIQVVSVATILEKNIPHAGVFTSRGLSAEEAKDARRGWDVAEGIGKLDIGQTVVVYQGLVVSVEAVEGTDAAIHRAGELTVSSRPAGLASLWKTRTHGPVVVKVCKPQQDERMDLPTVGVGTIESMKGAGATALVLSAGRALLIDPGQVVERANAAGIALVAVSGREEL